MTDNSTPAAASDLVATPASAPPLTGPERAALDARATQITFASVERLAQRFPRAQLGALWAVLDAHRDLSPQLEARAREALAEADALERYADASNECGPGFPRDDPGPWHWMCLSSLCRAAALAHASPHEALLIVDGAAYAAAYPSRALQESERAWRRTLLSEAPVA